MIWNNKDSHQAVSQNTLVGHYQIISRYLCVESTAIICRNLDVISQTVSDQIETDFNRSVAENMSVKNYIFRAD